MDRSNRLPLGGAAARCAHALGRHPQRARSGVAAIRALVFAARAVTHTLPENVHEREVRLAVPHGIVVIGDRDEDVPGPLAGAPMAASDAVVALATLHEVDGDLTIRLSTSAEKAPLAVRAFSGRLRLPNRRLTVCNTSDEVLLELAVPDGFAHVTVWTNDARNPDEIVVAVT